jgi:membrane protease YdiL (CAAX protease family)
MTTSAPVAPFSQVRLTPGQRCFSLAEVALGTFLVIGHNVYHIVPNEVPFLFVLFWVSLRLRDGGWKVAGLRRPASWKWTIGIALGVAALRILMGEIVIDPLTSRFFPPEHVSSLFNNVAGNWKTALLTLLLIWTFAAFGEELGYRGYLLTRAADVGGRSPLSYWAGMIFVSVLFGFGHYYKGPAGVIDSGIAGLILGSAYLLSRRNLWVCILAHGFIDTFAVVVAFLGWAS